MAELERREPISIYVYRAVAERDYGWRCHYCGINLIPPDEIRNYRVQSTTHPTMWVRRLPADHALAVLDHIVPRSQGGTDHIDNFVLACGSCNTSRGVRPYAEFIDFLWNHGTEHRAACNTQKQRRARQGRSTACNCLAKYYAARVMP